MAHPLTAHSWSAPRPGTARAAPITYQPRRTAPEHGDLPQVATWLTVDERLRVDAAGHDVYASRHFDDLASLVRALATTPHAAILVSVTCLARGGRTAGEALADLLRASPGFPVAALVSTPVDLTTVLALGRAGVRAVVDVQRPDGWTTLRATLAGAARPAVAQLAASTLAPAVADFTADVRRFVAALFEAPPSVVTVRDLARGLGVLPTTLMSRFYRAALPAPKRYLAFARLTRASYLLHAPGWTVAATADYLQYSSAQGFSRHLHLLMGVRPAEFRRRFDVDAMLARFRRDLLDPHHDALRTFWPLRAGDPGEPPDDARAAASTAAPPSATPPLPAPPPDW